MKEKITWKHILSLQAVVVIYSIASMMAKFASGELAGSRPLENPRFYLFFVLDIAALGIYAVLWQQLIKHFALSVAYTNRAMALLWSVVWSVVIFREQLTLLKAAGVVLVILGTVIVNLDETRGGKTGAA